MPVTCTASSLMGLASCQDCIPGGIVQSMRIVLFCAIANGETTINTSSASLVAASRCFHCLDAHTRTAIEVYLLCQIANGATVTCTPMALVEGAKCFFCLPDDILEAMIIYLLCAKANGTAVTCTPAAIAVLAKCFICLPLAMLRAFRVTLWCYIANGTAITCSPAALAAFSGAFIGARLDTLQAMELVAVINKATGTAAVVDSALLTSLVAYYKMGEASGTRSDSTANANNLTDINTVTQEAGIVGNAARFTNTNSEYLSIADTPSLSMGDFDFSIALWVWVTSNSGVQSLIGKGTAASYTTVEFLIERPNVSKNATFYVGNGVTGGTCINTLTPLTSLSTWYFVYAEHDAIANQLKVRVNDATEVTAVWAGGSYNSALVMEVGRWPTIGGAYMNGRIDEVGIWKRKLTAAEVTTLYNAGAGQTWPFTGL